MGQYYKVVNIDKKEYMYAEGGIKLMEWSYNRNPLVLNMIKKLANEWKGDRVFVVGDYALSEDRIDSTSKEKEYDYELLVQIEKELNIYQKKDGKYPTTIYHYADENFKQIKLEKLEEEQYKYIYNHKRKEYIDLEHCPLAWLYKDKNKYIQVKIAPISLLLALGNGMGGGDYWGNNGKLVGKYINDIRDLEFTKEPLNLDYIEFRPEFYEDTYIPYNEIINEINLQKEKEKLSTDIVNFISKYDNKKFREYYSEKENAKSRIGFSLDCEPNRKMQELSEFMEGKNQEDVKEKARELIKRINDYKLEKIVRSNKSKSDIEFINKTEEDKYINETYKKIFEQLKLNNIENITTNNRETTIVFETQEKYTIKTKEQNEIKDYLENTKNIEEKSKNQKETIRYKELNERISKKQKNPNLFYYEYRENDGEKVIEKGVWVDYAGTLVTNKDILKDKEYIDSNQLFNNPKILMIYDEGIKEKINEKLEVEEEEVK